jgi:hypothetical protein
MGVTYMVKSKERENRKTEIKTPIKRPDELKIIIGFYVIVCIISLFQSPIIAIVSAVVLYYGLWKMQKSWMYFFIFRTILGMIIFGFAEGFNIFYILDIVAICWLYINRNLFK